MLGAKVDGGGGGSWMWSVAVCSGVWPSKGSLPVTSWKSRTPHV